MDRIKDLFINLILDIIIVMATLLICVVSVPLGILSFIFIVIYKVSETIGVFVRDIWLWFLNRFDKFLKLLEEREKDEEGE